MILAGGLGKRLRTVVDDRPKPLALVDGRPFLEILVESLARKGVRDFVFLTGYLSHMIEDHFNKRNLKGLSIRFSREDKPLGTGGAVKHAEAFATDPTLLVNGDTFFDANLDDVLAFHSEKRARVTLSLFRVEDVSRYGFVTVDSLGVIQGFTEKRASSEGPGLINAGLSLLSRDFIRGLPPGRPYSMEQEIFPRLAGSGDMVGFRQEGAFFDIGTPESYHDFISFVRNRGLLAPRD
jgi:D-glycero-alpha-D-manno-heptose 1-phosphate guanylyltransferase